jgi:hypothetical protein
MPKISIENIGEDLNLRSEEDNRLTIEKIDVNALTLQQTSLASSNSLVYKSASYSVNSNTSLPNPSQGYFNSRTIPSGIYSPFQDGSSFVFKFSDTDHGYYASASSTSRWWSVLSSVETAYEKRLSISQIGVSYNYWEFKMDSLSFTNSTWIFSGQKILGPTYSNFQPEKQFTIGYSLASGMTGGGSTNSIAGEIVDGYTTLNYPLISETLYLGDLTSPISIGVTGGNDFLGPGLGVENLYLGSISFAGFDPDEPVPNFCWGLFKRRRPQRIPGCPSCPPERPARSNSNGQQIYEVPSDYFEVLSTATNSQGISNFVGVHVGALTIGLTESNSIEMAVMTPTGWTSNWGKPTKILAIGSYVTSSNNNFYDSVGIDTYAMSTSYLEITPITYSTDATNILLNGTWGTESGGTYSVLNIDSDAVSVNKLFFGDITNGQSVYVSGGDLYVNDVVFSGGSASQGPVGATGADGPVGATGPAGSPNYGTQSFTFADTVSVTHSFGRYPIIQAMDTTYDPPQMFTPAKIEYTTIDSFLVTFATASSGILIYMC